MTISSLHSPTRHPTTGTLKDLQLNDGSVTSPSAQQLMLLLQHPEILGTYCVS